MPALLYLPQAQRRRRPPHPKANHDASVVREETKAQYSPNRS